MLRGLVTFLLFLGAFYCSLAQTELDAQESCDLEIKDKLQDTVLTHQFFKLDCSLNGESVKGDTLLASKAEGCGFADVEGLADGFWQIRSKSNSTQVLEEFFVRKGKIEGVRKVYKTWEGDFIINYKDGHYHGAFLRFDEKGNVILIVNYKEGKIKGDYYFYGYTANSELSRISRYSEKGKLKERENFVPETIGIPFSW